MSIWNKVLVGFVFVMSVAFFYLAMRTLKTRQYWCESARQFQQKIDQLDKEDRELLQADPADDSDVAAMGIERLRVELHKMLIDRGRVWANCTPQVQPQTGKVTVTFADAGKHGIGDKTVVYAFEQKDVQDGGSYLGEFKVVGVDEDKVALEPATTLDVRELQRLDASKGPWIVYEILPADSYRVYAWLDEDAKKKMLPAGTVAEFIKHGQPATEADLQAWGVQGAIENGKYARALRDYEFLLAYYQLQRAIQADLIESTKRDLQYVESAAADALQQVKFRQDESARLTVDRDKYTRERDAVAAHQRILAAALAVTQKAVGDLIQRNLAIVDQIAKIQANAKLQIDARSRGVAQAVPGQG